MIRRYALLFVLAGSIACGGSTPQSKTDPRDEANALLDAPVVRDGEGGSTDRRASAEETMLVLPETPEAPSKSIDGEIEKGEWDIGDFRRFDRKSAVETGTGFWRGGSDASFRVGLEADAGYIYFAVQVKDDVVIKDGGEESFSDAVVIHLRDPALDALVDSLPASMGIRNRVLSQTAIAFLPNGKFFRYGSSDSPISGEMIYSAVDVRKNGYVLEVALQMEVLHQASSLPLDEIAFRIEVMDGDEPKRPGTQTVLSILPNRGDDSPRMALFSTGGLLPHGAVASRPPREKAIGRWQHDDGTWTFESFEEVPRLWMTIGDRPAFEEALESSDALDELCRTSVKDVELLEAYSSRGGGFRAGLVLCGARAPNGICREGSQSNLFWVGLKRYEERWVLEKWANVFGEPLGQCTYSTHRDGTLYSGFSAFPVDVVDNDVWAVGWTRTRSDVEEVSSVNGVTFINVEGDGPIADVTTQQRISRPDERIRANSSVYLTEVDDKEGLDICQIETILEQDCTDIDRGCRTRDHGTFNLSHIQLYKPRTDRFERYELTKHPNCSAATFDPRKIEGYLLLQNEGRVGIVNVGQKGSGPAGDDNELF